MKAADETFEMIQDRNSPRLQAQKSLQKPVRVRVRVQIRIRIRIRMKLSVRVFVIRIVSIYYHTSFRSGSSAF